MRPPLASWKNLPLHTPSRHSHLSLSSPSADVHTLPLLLPQARRSSSPRPAMASLPFFFHGRKLHLPCFGRRAEASPWPAPSSNSKLPTPSLPWRHPLQLRLPAPPSALWPPAVPIARSSTNSHRVQTPCAPAGLLCPRSPFHEVARREQGLFPPWRDTPVCSGGSSYPAPSASSNADPFPARRLQQPWRHSLLPFSFLKQAAVPARLHFPHGREPPPHLAAIHPCARPSTCGVNRSVQRATTSVSY
jgi:hypothetical protein